MAKNQIDFSPTNPENMAAGAPTEVEEEDAPEATEDQSLEVAIGPEKEEKPEVVTLTPEEFAALKASGDSARAVQAGLEGLASKLGAQQAAPAPMPVNAPQQTAEEFFAEHSDEIFDKEKGAAVLKKFTKMASEQEYGGLLRGLSTTLANTRKELLETKDPHYKKYSKEVEALVASQPPDVRIAPDIYERAWAKVRNDHQNEIEEEVVNDKVAKAVEAKLKELGIDPNTKAGDTRPAAHVNSAGRSIPERGSRAKVRFPDEATKTKLDAEADRRGIEREDLYRARGYLK